MPGSANTKKVMLHPSNRATEHQQLKRNDIHSLELCFLLTGCFQHSCFCLLYVIKLIRPSMHSKCFQYFQIICLLNDYFLLHCQHELTSMNQSNIQGNGSVSIFSLYSVNCPLSYLRIQSQSWFNLIPNHAGFSQTKL